MAQIKSHPSQKGSANGIEKFMAIESDPKGKHILDPYSLQLYDIHYQIRNSVGITRVIGLQTAGAPDMISWSEYRTHDYWWILCIVNKVIRGERELSPSNIIFIPSHSDLTSYLQALHRQQNGARIVRLGVTPVNATQ